MRTVQLTFWTALASVRIAYAVTGQLGDAQAYGNNPAGAAFIAEFGHNSPIKGGIIATSAGSAGTQFTINFWNLPAEDGPFGYHIHVAPVPDDGNCTTTLGHLDPYIRGDTPVCDSSQPATCQVGDLSGKYGKASDSQFSASYTDPYVALTEGIGSFFGNRSFVIHRANSSRLACASFRPAEDVLGEGWFPFNGGGRGRGGNWNGGSRPSFTRRESSVDNATPTLSALASWATSWASANGVSLPTNFGDALGGFGKPTVTTRARFGIPGADMFPAPSSGALSSIYSQYSKYWSGSSWPTSGALSTVYPTTTAMAVIPSSSDDLPVLPTAVMASGFNFSTSVLSTSVTGTPAPLVFTGDAASKDLASLFSGLVVLTAIMLLC